MKRWKYKKWTRRGTPGAAAAATGARDSYNRLLNKSSRGGLQTAPIYRLRISPRSNGGDIRRLRQIFKTLLRRFDMRCLSVDEERR